MAITTVTDVIQLTHILQITRFCQGEHLQESQKICTHHISVVPSALMVYDYRVYSSMETARFHLREHSDIC